MTISLRSWRCFRRRALARISIIVMFGESSMNIGAEDTSPILRASLAQSSSFMLPLRMWFSGTFASAESRRMVISERVISRLKKQLVRLLWMDAARHRSSASVDEPAQDRLLAHDLGVVAGVGRDRHVGRERVEVRGPADPLELAASLQL